MSEVVAVIDPDSGAGYDYTSLAAAIADSFAGAGLSGVDLVSNTENLVVKCRCTGGTADTTAATLSGFTTNGTYDIKIWTDTGESYRHDGSYSTGNKYRMEVSDTCLTISNQFVTIDGLQFKMTSTGNNKYGILLTEDNNTISTCLFWDSSASGNSHYAVIVSDSDGDGFVLSNLVGYDWNADTFRTSSASDGTKFLNLVSYGAGSDGIFAGFGDAKALNCISYVSGGNDFSSGSWSAGSDYNFSEDDTAPGTRGGSPLTIWGVTDGKTPDFVDTGAGTEDFHLQDTSDAIGAGAGPTTDGDCPTTDIDGDTRSGATCDIGADEYVAAGGTTIECSAGAITLAAHNVVITAGTTIQCSLGSIALTGYNASISAGTTINCTTGSVTLSGYAASILAGTTVLCSVGSITIAGYNASISAGTTIECSLGAIVLSAQTASISSGTTIECTTGSITIIGYNATISVTPAILYWRGGVAGNAWNNAANWSASDGGAGGAGVPASNTAVFFTNTRNVACTLTAGAVCGAIATGPLYSQIIDLASSGLEVTGSLVSVGGNILRGDADLTIGGNFSKSGGALIFDESGSSPTWSVGGNFIITSSAAIAPTNLAGHTIGIDGNLSLTGPAELLDLTADGIYYLNVGGSAIVSKVKSSNCDASGGTTIDASDGTSTNSGGNQNWLFQAVTVECAAGSIVLAPYSVDVSAGTTIECTTASIVVASYSVDISLTPSVTAGAFVVVAGQIYTDGPVAAEVYVDGAEAGETYLDGAIAAQTVPY